MKIFVVATPKSGNVWLENLLAKAYEIPIVGLSGKNSVQDVASFLDSESAFSTHQHLHPNPEFIEWAKLQNVNCVSIIRHPGDVLVSLYHYVNNFAPFWEKQGVLGTSPSHVMVGEPLDSPKVVEYLANTLVPHEMHVSLAWIGSGEALWLRYEDLHKDPKSALRQLTNEILPVSDDKLESAIQECRAERMREQGDKFMKLHIRKGKAGSWRTEFSQAHFDALESAMTPELRSLGYSADPNSP